MSSSRVNTGDPLPTTSPNTRYSVAYQWMGLSQAHQAVMLDDRMKLLKSERMAVSHHRARYQGTPLSDENEDENVIHIGDVNHHQHSENPHLPTTKGGLGPIASGLLGAALTLGTGGAGFGLFQALKPAVETVLTRDADISVGHPIVEPPQEE